MKKFNYCLIVSTVLLLLLSCGRHKPAEQISGGEAVPVKIQALNRGEQQIVISATGLISTDDETVLSFKTGGVISKVLVKQGDPLKKGQLLAVLNLTEVNAGYKQAQLALDKAKRDYTRASRLFADSVATLEQKQNAATALAIAEEQLRAAGFNRAYSEIRASGDGFVLQRFANEGQVVAPGTPVFQVNGGGSGGWIVKVGLSDRQWAQCRVNDSASVVTDALPHEVLRGYVYRKSEGVDPSSGIFTVFLKLKAERVSKLASGMFAKARIFSSHAGENGWSIPYDALLEGDAGIGYVFVTNDKKTARKVEVKIQNIGKDMVNISEGLEDAKYLIISGSPYLNNGSAIKIQ